MRRLALGLVASLVCTACAGPQRALVRDAKRLARDLERDRQAAVTRRVHPAARDSLAGARELDRNARKERARAMRAVVAARPEAVIRLEGGRPTHAVWTDEGWRLEEDPTQAWRATTPRGALASLVWATRQGEWERVLDLAPRRFRVGLSAADLETAWADPGPAGQTLRAQRDRLAEHLEGAMLVDEDEGFLPYGTEGEGAWVEREGDRWVVVDF